MAETNEKGNGRETEKRKPGRPRVYSQREGRSGDAQKRWRERQIASGKQFLQIWTSPETALKIKEMVGKEREKEKNARKK